MLTYFNTGRKINIFCVNTPFQEFVVNQIISQYLDNECNIIISTIINSKGNKRTIVVSSSLYSLLQVRVLLHHIINNIQKCTFFVPHLSSLFSSLFYGLSLKYNRPINVFYEGIALYYESIMKQSFFLRIKRKIQCFLIGEPYHYYESLYPKDFVDRVDICYAPNRILLDKYKKICIVKFRQEEVIYNQAILLLLSNEVSSSVETKLIDKVKNLIKEEYIEVLYLKPHYELDDITIKHIENSLYSVGIKNVVTLNKSLPIESLYTKISFKMVISQAFSSALINMKLIFPEQPKMYILEKDKETIEIANKFELNYE